MTYVYSGFSRVLWSIYVPFAIGVLEIVRWRKRALAAFEVAGLAVGLYLLYYIETRPVVAQVVSRHIVDVAPRFYLAPVIVVYLAATCMSAFFSSHRFVKLFGALAPLSVIAAYVIYAHALVSVWCFFAALLNVLCISTFDSGISSHSRPSCRTLTDIAVGDAWRRRQLATSYVTGLAAKPARRAPKLAGPIGIRGDLRSGHPHLLPAWRARPTSRTSGSSGSSG